MPFNNYKKRARGNWDQSKERSNIFELDKGNSDVKKNNGVILESDYDCNNM